MSDKATTKRPWKIPRALPYGEVLLVTGWLKIFGHPFDPTRLGRMFSACGRGGIMLL